MSCFAINLIQDSLCVYNMSSDLIHLFTQLAFVIEWNQRTVNTPGNTEHVASSLTMAALRNKAFRVSLRITT